MEFRHATDLPETPLQSFAQALKALGKTDYARFPVRIGQHKMEDQMFKWLLVYTDPQLGHVGEIRLAQAPGRMLLRKPHLPARPFRRPPHLDPALKGPQLAVGKLHRMLSL